MTDSCSITAAAAALLQDAPAKSELQERQTPKQKQQRV
jgi:hypothetical protein